MQETAEGAHGPAAVHTPLLRIQPSIGWAPLQLAALWEYRELLYFLMWRDIKVRYKQTALGVIWAIIQPLATMMVFSIFFGRLAKVPSDGVPYPLFAFAALVPWNFFANGITFSADSLVGSGHLIKKVYFPRLIIPLAAVSSGIVDFLVAFTVLVGLMALHGVWPTAQVIWLPLFVVLALATALGMGLWLSALNVQYRDVRFVLPFLSQFWMFATPIAYPSTMLTGVWRTLYGLNPMVGVVEGFRWALLGSHNPSFPMLAVSCATSLTLLVSGAFYFRKMERFFADRV